MHITGTRVTRYHLPLMNRIHASPITMRSNPVVRTHMMQNHSRATPFRGTTQRYETGLVVHYARLVPGDHLYPERLQALDEFR